LILTGQPVEEVASRGAPNTVRAGHLVARWWGTVYRLGEPIGAASIKRFLAELCAMEDAPLRALNERFDADAPGRSLRGTFLLWVGDSRTGEQACFIDHAGLFRAAYTDTAAGPQLLPLVDHCGLSIDDFDVDAAVEFLTIGYVDNHRSMVRGANFFPHDLLFYWGTDGSRQTKTKNLQGLAGPVNVGFDDFFEGFAQTLRHETVSVDLTGGFDSRLNAVLLHRAGLEFEVTMTGREGQRDVALAHRVARVLGKELRLFEHQPDPSFSRLEQYTEELDGHLDPIQFSRLDCWYGERSERGFSTAISGSGGELFAEYWWLQDAPRFNAKTANLARLYDLRMASLPFPIEHFGAFAAASARSCRYRIVDGLARHRQRTNTETYDQIFVVERMPGLLGPATSAVNRGAFNLLTPLNDWDVMSTGFKLPRRQRFFRQFHRAKIHAAHPAAGRCASTERVSCGYGMRAALIDPPRYTLDKVERLTRKIIQRFGGTNWRYETPNHPQLHALYKADRGVQQLIAELAEDGFLAPGLTAADLRDGDLGRAISVALIRRRLRSA
jgi:hypothetical protein